jgi:hypothetical protein
MTKFDKIDKCDGSGLNYCKSYRDPIYFKNINVDQWVRNL